MIKYNGFLTDRTIAYVKDIANRHPHIIEIKYLPDDFQAWCNHNMQTFDIPGEDCQGRPTFHKSHLFGTVTKNESPANGQFLFFHSLKERDAFVCSFPEVVVNEQPFTVEF